MSVAPGEALRVRAALQARRCAPGGEACIGDAALTRKAASREARA